MALLANSEDFEVLGAASFEVRPERAAENSQTADIDEVVFQEDDVRALRRLARIHQQVVPVVLVEFVVAQYVDHATSGEGRLGPFNPLGADADVASEHDQVLAHGLQMGWLVSGEFHVQIAQHSNFQGRYSSRSYVGRLMGMRKW
mgnify:CR=1 FL=1